MRALRASAALVLFAATAAQANAIRYDIVSLGTLGGNFAQAYGLNSHGEVVGTSFLPPPDGGVHAFRYSQGAMMSAITQFDGPMIEFGDGLWSHRAA